MLIDSEKLAEKIHKFAISPDAVLFSGAGVSARAGYPTWEEYVQDLASIAEPYEKETADLMRKRWAAGLLGEAVSLYQSCPRIPVGDKSDGLVNPFVSCTPDSSRLRALMALPFTAVVTTNFDRSQHEAYAQVHESAPQTAELGDPTLKEAIYKWSEFYIARIHGRLEAPSTMVVSSDDFARVVRESDYLDFLHHILTRKRCLFMGFSFMDPAIKSVLKVYKERVGPAFPDSHLAIVPKSASTEIKLALPNSNIDWLEYSDDKVHSVLWDAIREALNLSKKGQGPVKRTNPEPHAMTKKVLAIAYARSRMGEELDPLREVVLDGLVLGLLSQDQYISEAQLRGNLRSSLGLTSQEAKPLLKEALDRLQAKDWVAREKEKLIRTVPRQDKFGGAIRGLVDGIAERLVVRYGSEISRTAERALSKVLEDLVLVHGWELGAEFSTGRGQDYYDIDRALVAVFDRNRARFHGFDPTDIQAATRDLLKQPTEKESKILNGLARISFGTELALDRGVALFSKHQSLPDAIYLDASVLMPAIAIGHPLQSAYSDAIEAIIKSAANEGRRCRVMVLESFLNEVVSHRSNSFSFMEQTKLGNPEDLARFIDLVGAVNTNVYVGAYSSFIERRGPKLHPKITFREYLSRYAPYGSEESLSNYLERLGIEAVKTEEVQERIAHNKEMFYVALRNSYEDEARPYSVSKADILIKHEARQLASLAVDLKSGIQSIFVTADSKLRRLVKGELLATVADSLFSQGAFLHLVDLLAGLRVRNQDSLARIMWGVGSADGQGVLKGYLLDRGLREYDAGLAMKLPKLAKRLSEEMTEEEAEKLRGFGRVKNASQASQALRHLDRYEEKFFEGMAAEIRSQKVGE